MTTRRLDDIPGYDAWKLMTPEDAEESYGREMFAPSNAGPDTTTHGNATSTNVTTHTHT